MKNRVTLFIGLASLPFAAGANATPTQLNNMSVRASMEVQLARDFANRVTPSIRIPIEVGSPVTWTPATWGTGPKVVSRGNKTDFVIPATSLGNPDGNFGAAIISSCVLSGDFDYEVTYKLARWPRYNGMRFALIADGTAGINYSGRTSYSHHDYYAADEVHEFLWPFVYFHTDDLAGKLRLKRVDGIVYGYYWNGLTWILTGSGANASAEVRPSIQTWVPDSYFDDKDIKISISNFRKSEGQWICN